MLQRPICRQRKTVGQHYGCVACFKNCFPDHSLRHVPDRHPAIDENFQQRPRRRKPGIVSFQAGFQATIHSRQDRRHLIERSFSRNCRYGFKRARWRRTWRVQIQEYLTAAIQNIMVLLRHVKEPAPVLGMAKAKPGHPRAYLMLQELFLP